MKKEATKNQDLDELDGIDHQGMQLKGENESLQQVPEESVTERQIPPDQADQVDDSGVRSPASTQKIQFYGLLSSRKTLFMILSQLKCPGSF